MYQTSTFVQTHKLRLFIIDVSVCMCACVYVVVRGQLGKSQFSLPTLGVELRLPDLHSNCPYPLNHLASPYIFIYIHHELGEFK